MRKPHFSGTIPQNWASGRLDPKAQDSAGFEGQAGPQSACPHAGNGGAGTQLRRTQPKSPPPQHFSAATTPGRKRRHLLLSQPTLSCRDRSRPFVQRIQACSSPGGRSHVHVTSVRARGCNRLLPVTAGKCCACSIHYNCHRHVCTETAVHRGLHHPWFQTPPSVLECVPTGKSRHLFFSVFLK